MTTPDLDTLDTIFEPWQGTDRPGCMLGLVDRGELILTRGYGMADIEHRIPITEDTVFHVGSVSKQFTVMAALLLAADEGLNMNDPLRRHMPEMHACADPITLWQLVHHTSGLRDQWQLWMLACNRMTDELTTDDILRLATAQEQLNFAPGSRHLYCNTGYTLLARVVERVVGQPFAAFCKERIFAPLGMEHTLFIEDHASLLNDRACSYMPDNQGGWRHFFLAFANDGATSLATTVHDLARWSKHFEEPILCDHGLIETLCRRGQLNDGALIPYAGGLECRTYRAREICEHAGADAGFRAHFMRLPELQKTIIILGNSMSLAQRKTANQVADLWLADHFTAPRASLSTPDEVVTPLPTPSHLLAGAAGDFYSRELDVVYHLRAEDDNLVLDRGKYPPSPMHCRGDLLFETRRAPGTVDDGPMTVRFAMGDDNIIDSFTISTDRVFGIAFRRMGTYT